MRKSRRGSSWTKRNAQHAATREGQIIVTTCRNGRVVWCRVTDDGPGVSLDRAGAIFRPFVTAKSRGDVTFVGPFRSGKVEGPCKSFPIDARDEVSGALVSFLESFLEEAATP